jgi:hypothetical protein
LVKKSGKGAKFNGKPHKMFVPGIRQYYSVLIFKAKHEKTEADFVNGG